MDSEESCGTSDKLSHMQQDPKYLDTAYKHVHCSATIIEGTKLIAVNAVFSNFHFYHGCNFALSTQGIPCPSNIVVDNKKSWLWLSPYDYRLEYKQLPVNGETFDISNQCRVKVRLYICSFWWESVQIDRSFTQAYSSKMY